MVLYSLATLKLARTKVNVKRITNQLPSCWHHDCWVQRQVYRNRRPR